MKGMRGKQATKAGGKQLTASVSSQKNTQKNTTKITPAATRKAVVLKEAPEEGSEGDGDESDDDYDESEESGEGSEDDDAEDEDDYEEGSDEVEDQDEDSSDGFEVQSSDDDDDNEDNDDDDDEEEDLSVEDEEREAQENIKKVESQKRFWNVGKGRTLTVAQEKQSGILQQQQYMHLDDLSSDDEDDPGNTIGRVPLHWYDAFDHIGYDISGAKMMKRKGKDRIDMALEMRDNPAALRTVYDMYNDREVVLSERELEIIRRIQAGAFAHPEYNDTPDYIDYFTHEKEIMPLSKEPEHKSSFVPSKWEMAKVMKIAKAINDGTYKFGVKKSEEKDNEGKVSLIWDDAENEVLAESKRNKFYLPAPRMPLPGHSESYNPPEEYLLNEEELQKYNELDPEDRPTNFVPKKHSCLRHVGGYQNFVKERFERCLDLYLCPRKLKQRLNIDPETLVPKLPHPRELKPFPNSLCLQFIGHSKAIRCISVSPDGQYLASASDDCTVRIWEVDTCLCKYSWKIGKSPVTSIAWNPDVGIPMIALAAGKSVVLVTTGNGDKDTLEVTETLLVTITDKASETSNNSVRKNSSEEDKEDDEDHKEEVDDADGDESAPQKKKNMHALWKVRNDHAVSSKGFKVGPRLELSLDADVSHISWHHKGDYLVVLSPSAGAKSISVHQISKGTSQFPFSKSPGIVQSVCFHPFLPCLIVVTQQHVKLFHLIEQRLIKKLLSGCKWLSSIDIHSSGDHIIVGSYDRRVVWFDLDLASTPYKTLKFHEKAVRDVKFHRRFPLMASASDDGNVHIFHGMIYNDLMRNPLIVPLKVLKGHGVIGDLGVLSIAFHPKLPWIFTAGADGLINLYQDI